MKAMNLKDMFQHLFLFSAQSVVSSALQPPVSKGLFQRTQVLPQQQQQQQTPLFLFRPALFPLLLLPLPKPLLPHRLLYHVLNHRLPKPWLAPREAPRNNPLKNRPRKKLRFLSPTMTKF